MPTDSDFIVQIKVKNGRLLRAIRATGFKSTAAFCRANGLDVNIVSAFLTMKKSPLRSSSDEWLRAAYDLSAALHMEPEELWPAHMQRMTTKKNTVELDATMDQAAVLTARTVPGLRGDLEKAMSHLTVREQDIIKRRFGLGQPEQTLAAVGDVHGICKDRVRQIEYTAMRKLRRPNLTQRLKDYLQELC